MPTDPLDVSSPERLAFEEGLDPWRAAPLAPIPLDDHLVPLAFALWSAACVAAGALMGVAL